MRSSGRRCDAVDLSNDQAGAGEVTGERPVPRQAGEVLRKLGERTAIANELRLPFEDRTVSVGVPGRSAGGRCDPAPAQDVLDRHLGDRLRRALQDRSRGSASVRDHEGETVEQQLEWMRGCGQRRKGADGATDVGQDVHSPEIAGRDCGAPRRQVRLASQLEVERLESPRRSKKQRRSVPAVARHHGEMAAQELCLGAPKRIELSGLCSCHSCERRVEGASLEACLRGGQRALGMQRLVLGQLDRASQERGGGGHAAASLGSPRRPLEFDRDRLVRTGC